MKNSSCKPLFVVLSLVLLIIAMFSSFFLHTSLAHAATRSLGSGVNGVQVFVLKVIDVDRVYSQHLNL